MVELQVYGDEAGTMPVRDSDDVFVGAAFSVADPSPLATLKLRRSNAQTTARSLAAVGAFPSCALVRPFPGYEAALTQRLERLSILSLSAQRVRGVSGYVPPEGLRTPNYVWMSAMKAAILRAIEAFVIRARTRPDRVVVFLNSKTLTPLQRVLAEEGMRELGVTFHRAILRMRALEPRTAQMYPETGVIGPTTIAIQWDDQAGFRGSPGAMFLADSLATNMARDLRRTRRKRGMRVALTGAGYDSYRVIDITRFMIAPLHAESIAQYERLTGVAVPWHGST